MEGAPPHEFQQHLRYTRNHAALYLVRCSQSIRPADQHPVTRASLIFDCRRRQSAPAPAPVVTASWSWTQAVASWKRVWPPPAPRLLTSAAHSTRRSLMRALSYIMTECYCNSTCHVVCLGYQWPRSVIIAHPGAGGRVPGPSAGGAGGRPEPHGAAGCGLGCRTAGPADY